MRWFHFILSHSIFVALCAAALCYQTFTLLHIPHNVYVYTLLFFSTLGSYNSYWLLSKYSFAKQQSFSFFLKRNRTYILLSLGAAIGMLYSLYFIQGLTAYVLLGVVFTLMYSLPLWPGRWALQLRRMGFLKTILLAFTWAYATVLLPAWPVLQTQSFAVIALFTARFFFIGMLCAIFDRRDAAIDKIRGLHSLATDSGQRTLSFVMYGSFIIYMSCGLFVRMHFAGNAQLIAFSVTGLAVAFVYLLSLKKRDYLFYYFVVDGMMLFSAAATYIATLY